jgi:hypothetical protein
MQSFFAAKPRLVGAGRQPAELCDKLQDYFASTSISLPVSNPRPLVLPIA